VRFSAAAARVFPARICSFSSLVPISETERSRLRTELRPRKRSARSVDFPIRSGQGSLVAVTFGRAAFSWTARRRGGRHGRWATQSICGVLAGSWTCSVCARGRADLARDRHRQCCFGARRRRDGGRSPARGRRRVRRSPSGFAIVNARSWSSPPRERTTRLSHDTSRSAKRPFATTSRTSSTSSTSSIARKRSSRRQRQEWARSAGCRPAPRRRLEYCPAGSGSAFLDLPTGRVS
jgi:hypothetical protein